MPNTLTLEMSLKPFYDLSDGEIKRVAADIQSQWAPLIRDFAELSIMLWTSDGSEILDYKGNLDDSFEWAKYIGVANPEIYSSVPDLPTERLSIHHAPRLYHVDAPNFTYGDLRRIVLILKELFGRNGKPVKIGTTFDPGPEFAKSRFKYERHNEICMANTLGAGGVKSFVCCYAQLREDETPYAGFPTGISEGTSIGVFLGRQSRIFCGDIGFDYIWLSNGFGYGLETWGVNGAVFDGVSFDSSVCETVKRKILSFWRDFRGELGDIKVKTRGTNLSTAMDLASDAVPLRDIYAEFPEIPPPVNSPWAALNGDFGAEMAGWLSHVAELPRESGYAFRFYTHDPWFINSPWLDRYGRQPHDIYLPLALSRINSKGDVQTPNQVNLLTVDNSYGETPEQVPVEVIPHLKFALSTRPDAPGPFVWLYPFDEYHNMTFSGESVDEVFFGDWFMRSAVNAGLPLSTVVSTRNFQSALSFGDKLRGCVVFAPTAISKAPRIMGSLKNFIEDGGKALLYGPVNDAAMSRLVGVELTDGVSGELDIVVSGRETRIKHEPLYSGGDVNTKSNDPNAKVLASVAGYGETLVLAQTRSLGKGEVAWIRGTNSFTIAENGRYPQMLDKRDFFHPESLMRTLLGKLGFIFEFDKYNDASNEPVFAAHYQANALWLSCFVPNLNTTEKLSFPEGAPVFTGKDTVIENERAVYHLARAERLECRIFIEMDDGEVGCEEHCLCVPEVRRRLKVCGLKNATLRFRPESRFENTVSALLNPEAPPFLDGDFLKPELESTFPGVVLTYRNVSGDVLISW